MYCNVVYKCPCLPFAKNVALIFNKMKTTPSHLRSPVQNAKTGNTSLMYQAEIILGVPSDHAYGDKHEPVSS